MSTIARHSHSTLPPTPTHSTFNVTVGGIQLGLGLAAAQKSSASSVMSQMSSKPTCATPLAPAPSFASVDMVVQGLELVRHEDMIQRVSSYRTKSVGERTFVLPAHHKVLVPAFKQLPSVQSTRTTGTRSDLSRVSSSFNMSRSSCWTTPAVSNNIAQPPLTMPVNKVHSKFGAAGRFEGFTMVRSDAPESIRKKIFLADEVAYILEKTHPLALEYDDEYDDDTASTCSDAGECDQDVFEDVDFISDVKATKEIQALDLFTNLTLAADLYDLEDKEMVRTADMAGEALITGADVGTVDHESTNDAFSAAASDHTLSRATSYSSAESDLESMGPVTPKMRTVGLVLVDGEDAYMVQQDELTGAELLTLIAV